MSHAIPPNDRNDRDNANENWSLVVMFALWLILAVGSIVASGCAPPSPVIIPPTPTSANPAKVDPQTVAPRVDAAAIVRQVVSEIIAERGTMAHDELSAGLDASPLRDDSPGLPSTPAPAKFPKIKIWTQANCPPCAREKRELTAAGIQFEASDDIADHPRALWECSTMRPVTYWEAGGRIRYVIGWYGVDDLRSRAQKTISQEPR
ncbi:MAG: hypothetical protein NT069_25885 [Planctomycetota bacterium]|nr:hypothetical protein [Planctomycetota bacterium]